MRLTRLVYTTRSNEDEQTDEEADWMDTVSDDGSGDAAGCDKRGKGG